MKIGDVVSLRLMKREKGSLTVNPVESESSSGAAADNKNQHCKLIEADPFEVIKNLVCSYLACQKHGKKKCYLRILQ